jgi:hypothetical protein
LILLRDHQDRAVNEISSAHTRGVQIERALIRTTMAVATRRVDERAQRSPILLAIATAATVEAVEFLEVHGIVEVFEIIEPPPPSPHRA